MTGEQALALLRAEVQAGSPAGKALLAYLEFAELTAYRQTARTTDALALATFTGRGQGVNSILTALSPTAASAQQDRPQRL